MKNKAIVFKILAAVIAIERATAAASGHLSPTLTSIYVRYTTADTDKMYCTFVGTCDIAGTNPCTVRVQIEGHAPMDTIGRYTTGPNANTCATSITASNTTEPPVFKTILLPSDATLR
jgi:hypothetical protein